VHAPRPVSHYHASQGLRLHYLDWGQAGAPVVFLVHGARDHARAWDDVARALVRDGWRVIAPDLRGHGDSDWSPDAAYLVSYHLLDLADLIDHVGEAAFTLVGHSFGGLICARYAAMYPERVRKLVLADGMGPGPDVWRSWDKTGSPARSRDWIERRRQMSAKGPPRFSTLAEAAARMAAGNPHLSLEQAEHMARHGVREVDGGLVWKSDPLMNVFPPEDFVAETAAVYEAIVCPVLLIWGTKSYTSHPEVDGRWAGLKDKRLVLFEGAGHWLTQERADDFLRELRAFLG
jgi:pimeloyl-ACP methyl ester carboxylesterase